MNLGETSIPIMMIKCFNSFLNSFLIYFESHFPMLHTTKKLITLGSHDDLEYSVQRKVFIFLLDIAVAH